MNKRVLIITAHLDDFEIGMGGTAAKLAVDSEVHLLVLCKGDRPGNDHVSNPRRDACTDNCNNLNIKYAFYDYSDTKLDQAPQLELCQLISHHVDEIKPHVVYTHNETDVHVDHQIVSRCVKVACRMRPESTVYELYEFTIPGSSDWSFKPKVMNTHVDITLYSDIKLEMIAKYETEVRPAPDPISIDMIETRDKYHGSLCGTSHAEIFNQVFRRC